MPFSRQGFTGFPFEREPDRDGHFRSQLDDLAKRHPELAEHLGTFSRRRQSGGSAGDSDDFHRRFERPFGSNFDRFSGFPFDRDNFDPEAYAQQFYQQQGHQPQQGYQQPQSYQYQPQQEYRQEPRCSSSQEQENTESGRNNIQQSNTIDLGQKQDPVNERNQRSMSAPPSEKGQRFTSSINIPVNQPTNESENMAQTQPTENKTTERIIPIHIEGRDEPVIPKTAPPTYSQPQPERIFGQRPEQFTQYINREPKWSRPGFEQMHQGFPQEEPPRQQRFPQQQRPAPQTHQQHVPQQQKEEIPIPVQREVPQTKQQAPPPQQAAPPQPKPAPQQQKPKTPIDLIQDIQKDVSELMGQVENFDGKPKDKRYLYLDEMLTRNLIKLDNIDTQGQESIRLARKEAIKCIEKAISVLEAKAKGNVEPAKVEEKMEVEEKIEEQQDGDAKKEQTEVQTMETEPVAVQEAKVEENQAQQQESMELSPVNVTQEESVPTEEKKEVEKPSGENTEAEKPVVENRAVLVTAENKEAAKSEDKVEEMEVKEVPPVVAPEEAKIEENIEEKESNLPVAEAVKKFEGEKPENGKPEENKESQEVKEDEKKEEKKEKKKGKKKAAEKKEK